MTERRIRSGPLGAVGFWSGLAAGVALPFLYLGGLTAFRAIEGGPADYSGTVRSSGAALTSRGGVKLILADSLETFTQDCRGACDDLEVDSTTALYGEYRARVLDTHGACVACEWGPARTQGKITSFTLVGGGIAQTTHP